MAKCPYCLPTDNDYNLVVHYPDRLEYFIKHSQRCKCFKCKKIFYSTGSSRHFYDRMFVPAEVYEEIKKLYYDKNNLQDYILNQQLREAYLQLIFMYENNLNKQILLHSICIVMDIFLKQNNIKLNILRKQILKFNKNKLIEVFDSFIRLYKRYQSKAILRSSNNTGRYYDLMIIMLTYQYKIDKEFDYINKEYTIKSTELKQSFNQLIDSL